MKATSIPNVVKRSCFILMILSELAIAQPDTIWTRTYGGFANDEGHSVQQTTDGGFIIAGTTESFGAGGADVYLIKTDANGDTMWTRTYGGTGSDMGEEVQQTTDGGYIVVGYTESFGAGNSDVWLLKTDGEGDTLWTRTYGDSLWDAGNSVQQTSDGGYILTGVVNNDLWLFKTDSSGDTLWTRTYSSGYGTDSGQSVRETTDGGFIVAGGYSSALGAYLIRTDSNGDSLWVRVYLGGEWLVGTSVQQTMDGDFIVGSIGYRLSGKLIRTDAQGDTLWTRFYYPGGIYSVQQTTEGGFIMAGNGWEEFWLHKVDANGDSSWTQTYGDSLLDEGHSVQQISDGGYIVVGSTESFGAGGSDVWLLRFAPEVVSIEEESDIFPQEFSLYQNHPNPFNPVTILRYDLPKRSEVILTIYDVLGREIRTLVQDVEEPGVKSVVWDGTNDLGEQMSSGVYLYRIHITDHDGIGVGNHDVTLKMVLFK